MGNKEIKWKFVKYYPEKEEFTLLAEIKDMEAIAIIPVPKTKAREYYQNPDLLVASAVIGVISSDASSKPLKLTLQGPEGDIYNAKDISKGIADKITGMILVFVKGGCYQMGDTFRNGRSDEKPVHEVCVDDFYMGKYEVTQKEWVAIMGNNPSRFKNCDDCPVENVSWDYDVQKFIKRLNSKVQATSLNQQGKGGFRLPTETEWEYAARSGGRSEKYSGGNNPDSVAWYSSNSGGKTHPVGQKKANELGLYDMSGNVWEWVADWYDRDYYRKSPRDNPKGASVNSSVCSAAAHGTIMRGTRGQRSAAGTTPATGTSASGFAA